jgi:hypothetical protein
MKNKEERKESLFMVEEIIKDGKSKYEIIVEIAEKIKNQIELSGERDDSIVFKTLKEFVKKKNKKNK